MKKKIYYKLTEHDGKTRNNTQWGINVTHKAHGVNPDLCSNGWIHFYDDPLLAVLLNPMHANFKDPLLWEGEASGEIKHELLKNGSKVFTTVRQVSLPSFTTTQRIAFAILCAKKVFKDKEWTLWANRWLKGYDRSAEAAADAAAYATYAGVNTATNAAHAANAADAAANAATDAYDAYAATDAAHAAGHAAFIKINFKLLARKALKY